MPATIVGQAPSLTTFLRSLKTAENVDSSIELLISLLKRRQIKNSRPCAIATARLLLHVVAEKRWRDTDELIDRIREIGHRLVRAQPREMAVGNIVRRVLGVAREIAEDDEEPESSAPTDALPSPAITGESLYRPHLPTNISGFSPLNQLAALHPAAYTHSRNDVSMLNPDGMLDGALRRPLLSPAASYAGQGPQGSLFGILQHPQALSPIATPPLTSRSPAITPAQNLSDDSNEKFDIKAEVINGIQELLDELDIVDGQIAESALDHIHNDDFILTHTSSATVQKFLSTAARKRKFTVIHAEAYPNDHEDTHDAIVNGGTKTTDDDEDGKERWKSLISMGIKVIVIPDSAVFALMSRINKVILAPHTVLANGSLIAAAGASTIAQAANVHHVPVVVLSGVYKLSPIYPFATDDLIEFGDPGKVIPFQEGDFIDKLDVVNPLYDLVDADLIDLYITNLGGHAPSYLYRIVQDHYRSEDIDLAPRI